jgi:hypothetical protein
MYTLLGRGSQIILAATDHPDQDLVTVSAKACYVGRGVACRCCLPPHPCRVPDRAHNLTGTFGREMINGYRLPTGYHSMPRTFANVCISTGGQTTENRIKEIEAAGFQVDRRRVVSETVSGSSAREQQPGFVRLRDRLGRNGRRAGGHGRAGALLGVGWRRSDVTGREVDDGCHQRGGSI